MQELYKDEHGNQIERKTMVEVIDLKRNNKILMALTAAIYMGIVIMLWIIWKVLSTGAVNNYIAACV